MTQHSKPHTLSFWQVAFDRLVVRRAARIALVVGAILTVINQGDHLFSGQINADVVFKILLTFCVPYGVSTYSSYLAIRENSPTEQVKEQH